MHCIQQRDNERCSFYHDENADKNKDPDLLSSNKENTDRQIVNNRKIREYGMETNNWFMQEIHLSCQTKM